ncbi:hypothetical protein [Pseudonocardia phyllosphaerae]|uniref:hypothetical protein n=1 Tax=Pseudonocardia phyllosphaerae TaxID=3390502 RepID=UPI003979B8B0
MEKTVQKKKLGLVAAASAAALLGLSPLAFADSKYDEGNIDKGAQGAVAGLNGNNGQLPIQGCGNTVPVNVLGVQVPVQDANLLNGITGAVNGTAESGDSTTDSSGHCDQVAGTGDKNG